MPFSMDAGLESHVRVYFSENHFIPFHAGLDIEMKPYWEITNP